MESELLAIGQLARRSGLTVSALRFYDGAGVLTPAVVDPHSGYRWYSRDQLDDARLVARLRRVGLPLPAIGQVLACRSARPEQALTILDAHLRRLENGLSDARRELSAARGLIEQKETTMTDLTRTDPTMTDPAMTDPAMTDPAPAGTTGLTWIALPGAELAEQLATVLFAVSLDPELTALCGVLLDVDPLEGVLRLVTTDRYRMAISSVAGQESQGPVAQAGASTRFIDQAIALLAGLPGQVRLTLGKGQISLNTGPKRITHRPLVGDFPDYRRLIPVSPAHAVKIDVVTLRGQLEAAASRTMIREPDGEPYELTVLALDQDGVLTVATELTGGLPGELGGEPDGHPSTLIGVNREFLLQALNSTAADQLLLELDGPITPLAIRNPQRIGSFSLLMPSRLP